MLPTETAHVLEFLFPAANPAAAWLVEHDPGKVRNGETLRPAVTRIAAWNLADPQPSEAAIVAAAASPEFAAWLAERTDPAKNRRRLARLAAEDDSPQTMTTRALMKKIIRPAFKSFETTMAAYKAEIVRLGGNPANLPDPPNIRTPAVLFNLLQNMIRNGHGDSTRLDTETDL